MTFDSDDFLGGNWAFQNEWLTDGLTRVAVRGSNARPAAPRLADPLALYLNGVCPGCGVAPLSDGVCVSVLGVLAPFIVLGAEGRGVHFDCCLEKC